MSSRHPVAAITGSMLRGLLGVLILVALLDARDTGASELTASWTDNSGGGAAFRVERRLSTDTTFAALVDVPAGVTAYVDGSVAQGLSYCYRVKAYNNTGESAYSNEACDLVALDPVVSAPVPPAPVPSDYSVTITKSGNGDGTVTSTPAGLNCGSGCTVSYPAGTLVTLTATPTSGSKFSGWSGGCSGTAPCTVVGNASLTVGAAFTMKGGGRLRRASQ